MTIAMLTRGIGACDENLDRTDHCQKAIHSHGRYEPSSSEVFQISEYDPRKEDSSSETVSLLSLDDEEDDRGDIQDYETHSFEKERAQWNETEESTSLVDSAEESTNLDADVGERA
jgi:hypothetical protein